MNDLFGNAATVTTYQRRVINGFLQFRECSNGRPIGPWHFVIHGFGDTDCSVYDENEGLQRVAWSDRQRAIKIGRRWYKYPNWKH
jgi:hypothetical protein